MCTDSQIIAHGGSPKNGFNTWSQPNGIFDVQGNVFFETLVKLQKQD